MDKREMTVKVLARHMRNQQVHVMMRTHSLITDHDESMGGDDAGPIHSVPSPASMRSWR